MSYYDFDHFWESNRVCGQKKLAAIPKTKWMYIKEFWQQILDDIFDRSKEIEPRKLAEKLTDKN
jgi:hypothetical protein